MRISRVALALAAFLAGGFVGADPGAAGMLPVSGALATHDPTIVKAGDGYLRFSTGRGIPVASSPDLLQWTTAGSVFPVNPEWTKDQIPGSTDFWAPDVVQRGSEWRLYYAVSTFGSNHSAIGLAVNHSLSFASPTAGWTDRGLVMESVRGDDFNAIDPQVARNAEGQDWLVFGSFWTGIKMRPLSADGRTVGDRTVNLAQRPEFPDAIEGAYLYRHDGHYYLFVSFDFCCKGLQSTYNIRVGRSESFEGPYLDRDGKAMSEGGGTLVKARGNRDIGPGHNSILADGDKEYLVYHTYDVQYGGQSRLRIQELSWDADGWPLAPN